MIAGAGVGLVFAAGMILLIAGLRSQPQPQPPPVNRFTPAELPTGERGVRGWHVLVGVATGLVLLVLTRWPVLALAGVAGGTVLPRLVRSDRSVPAFAAQTEALATWLEGLRDTLNAGRGLEGAVVDTARRASPVIRTELAELVLEVQHGTPLRTALIRLADRLAHPISDKAVATIVLALDRDATRIADVISELAGNARDQAIDMVQVHAERARARTQLRLVIVIITGFVLFLAVAFGDYLAPYDTASGQAVLGVFLAMMAGCLVWMWRISQLAAPPRLIRPGVA